MNTAPFDAAELEKLKTDADYAINKQCLYFGGVTVLRLLATLDAERARADALEALLPLVAKVAAREQRNACIEALPQQSAMLGAPARVHNAPAPDVEKVIEMARQTKK